MKILYICNEYPPVVHGGIGSFTRDIAEAMTNIGVQVEVWGIYENINSDSREVRNGIVIHRIKAKRYKGRVSSLLFRRNFKKRLNLFLKENTFDIVECQEWLGLLPFGLNHKGFVVRLHGASIFFDRLLNRAGSRLIHFYERRMIKMAKNLVAVSDFCGRETLAFCGAQEKSYKVIYNCVDIGRLQKFQRDDFHLHKIVFANSVLRKKGVFELVESFNLIAARYPSAELHIIGKLGYSENGINIRELLEGKVTDLYRDRLKIQGWLNNAEDVYKELSSAHVCVYPSHMEGFGIAPVEPMALGRPVLFMKDGPGPEVVVDKVTGLLIDSFSAGDIAEKITQVFESEELVNTCKIEGPVRVKKLFDKNGVFARNNFEYYSQILND
jgi:glycosyltransferase involved in cell wall biosynthesis